MLSYEDGLGMLEWLATAFGFGERARMLDDQGRLTHGEMETDQGLIMLATGSPGYESPASHSIHCEAVRRWSAVPWVIDGVLVYVADVNEHYRRSREAGAAILSEPEDAPYGRLFRAEDAKVTAGCYAEARRVIRATGLLLHIQHDNILRCVVITMKALDGAHADSVDRSAGHRPQATLPG